MIQGRKSLVELIWKEFLGANQTLTEYLAEVTDRVIHGLFLEVSPEGGKWCESRRHRWRRLNIVCDEVAAGASFRDAAHMADISEQTLARWRGSGEAEPNSEFGEFCRALEAARVERRRWYRAEVLKFAREKKDFRGILAIAALTEPQEFTPKLHMIVEQQLTEAIDRLKVEFESEPELCERILQAIVDGPRASKAELPFVAIDPVRPFNFASGADSSATR